MNALDKAIGDVMLSVLQTSKGGLRAVDFWRQVLPLVGDTTSNPEDFCKKIMGQDPNDIIRPGQNFKPPIKVVGQ